MKVYGIDLLKEKSLWQIWSACVRHLPSSKFNLVITIFSFTLLVSECYFFPDRQTGRVNVLRELASAGLGFGSTILGFLIAGFTIFATLAKPDMLRRMYDVKHASGLPYLKVNFFAFVEVFIVYITILFFYLLITIIGGPNGAVGAVVAQSIKVPIAGYSIDPVSLVNIAYVMLSTASIYAFLALKSFIFNTYHAVMTSTVWSFKENLKIS